MVYDTNINLKKQRIKRTYGIIKISWNTYIHLLIDGCVKQVLPIVILPHYWSLAPKSGVYNRWSQYQYVHVYLIVFRGCFCRYLVFCRVIGCVGCCQLHISTTYFFHLFNRIYIYSRLNIAIVLYVLVRVHIRARYRYICWRFARTRN